MKIYIFTSLLILIFSFLLGAVIFDICNLDKYGYRFAAPFGFFSFLALLQICYYPIQVLHASSKWLHLFTFIIVLLILVLSMVKYKSIIKQLKRIYFNKKQIVALALIVILFIAVYYNTEISLRTDDLTFYVPFISNNINAEHLLTYSTQYDYQGYYHFIATVIYFLEKFNLIGIEYYYLPIGAITWIMSIVFYFLLGEIMLDIYNLMNKFTKNRKINIILLTVLLAYTFSFAWYLSQPYYGNTMRRINVIIILELCTIISTNKNFSLITLTSLLFCSLISETSTGFFFSAMIIYSLLLYFANSKSKDYISLIANISIFPAIFMILFTQSKNVLIFVFLLYLLFFLLKMTKKVCFVEKYINKYSTVILYLVPLLFCVIPNIPGYVSKNFNSGSFELENYNFFDPHAFESVPNYLNFSFYNLPSFIRLFFNIAIWCSTIYFLYQIMKKKNKNFLAFHIMTMILTFFNPFVFQFVAENITGVVYFRIYDLIFNSLTLFVIFYVFINRFKKYQLVMSIICGFLFVNEIRFNPVWWSVFANKGSDFNHLYHTSNKEIEVLDKLEVDYLVYEDEPITVASQIYSTESLMFTKVKNVIKNFADLDGMLNKNDFDSQFQRIFYRRSPSVEDIGANYLDACKFAREKNVEYVILDAQYNWELETGIGYCGEKLFEMHNYRVFQMHYDWLKE